MHTVCMALVKYRQMLTWVRLQVYADSMKLAETMMKII